MTFRRTRCPHCKGKLEPMQRIHVECIDPYAEAVAARKEREDAKRARMQTRVARAELRLRKEKAKPRSKWLAECQAIVNRYVRLLALSRGKGCYTCGATPEHKFGGTYDAGHFRSVGSAPHLRFWMPQIKLQCIVCNRHRGGMALAFRRMLVIEHGTDWVESLESMHWTAKHDIPYLIRLKAVLGKRLRRLEKRVAS